MAAATVIARRISQESFEQVDTFVSHTRSAILCNEELPKVP